MKKYPKYKDSKVIWIGEIPNDWDVLKFKYLFYEKKHTLNLTLNAGSISYGRVVFKDNEGIPEETKESYQEVLKGEFLINPLNLNFDLKSLRIGKSEIDVVVSSGYIVLILNDPHDKDYFKYLLHSFDIHHMKSLGNGVRQTISFKHLANEELILPSSEEQKRISTYLDHKTTLIDQIISGSEKKIELLKEQRTTTINHAVTKGLNSKVKMKDSGIEWIGEIPEGWELSKFKYDTITPVQYGLNISSDRYKEEGVRFIRITDLTEEGGLIKENGKYLEKSEVPDEFLLKKYDVLLCRSGHTVGKSYLHLEEGEYTSGGYLVRFNFSSFTSSKFIFYLTKTNFYWEWVKLNTVVSTIENVNGDKYQNFPYPKPPLSEQQQIVTYLDQKTKEIDDLISSEQKRIELMKEYRQSLISEVVTGKIKVTNH